jgi:pimeloyl-ACP methyl ester carboxylesterase
MGIENDMAKNKSGYASVNGLKMYYEIEGHGVPLVFIHPALSSSEMNTFPHLARKFQLIKTDLQGHGRTADIPERPITLEQHTQDLVGLLQRLGIAKAHFLGESYGGVVAVMLALRYPTLVDRVATYGASFGPPHIAHNTEMLRFDAPPTPDSRCFRFQRDGYKKRAPNPDYWRTFWAKALAIEWQGFSDQELASVKAPVLIALGDRDFVRLEHAIETFRKIPSAELAVIPSAGHFALFSEQDKIVPIVEHFLTKPEKELPVATAQVGYHPGETR